MLKGKFKIVENKSFETFVETFGNELTKDEQLLSCLHNYFIYKF